MRNDKAKALGFDGEKVFKNPADPYTPTWRKYLNHDLPHFFIIGAQKAGTSSLYTWLNHHPQLLNARQKETFFFNDINNYEKGLTWYRRHFHTQIAKAIKGPQKYSFDASANHFEEKAAAERLRKYFPWATVVVLLRNPIDRAYSHYQMAVRNGFELLPFAEAIEKEQERLAFGEEIKAELRHNYVYQKLGYLSKGHYAELLEAWFDAFGEEQLLIIHSEELFADTEKVWRDLLSYLNLDFHPLPHKMAVNQGNYEPMSPAVRERLKLYFAPKNRELETLLGRTFNWH